MNISNAVEEVKKALAVDLSVLLLGSPGIGKTTVAEMVAADLGLPYTEVRPAEFESVDFRGIPTVESGRTRWNVPDFWPQVPSLLNFDEITQAPMELTSPLLKLFLGGAIGDYVLPTGTKLMATGNLVSDRAGCSRLSSALRERCVVLTIEPNLSDWLVWFETKPFYSRNVAEFLKSNARLFHDWDSKNDWNQPTPRNWVRVARLIPQVPAEETLAGIIGPDVAKAFAAYCRANVELPTVEEIIRGVKQMPKSPAQFAQVVTAFATYATTNWHIGNNNIFADACATVERFDGTYQVQFLKQLAKNNPAILREPIVAELVKRHAKIICGTV
jgi:hypothetical protein